jgi:hypothetical protein
MPKKESIKNLGNLIGYKLRSPFLINLKRVFYKNVYFMDIKV